VCYIEPKREGGGAWSTRWAAKEGDGRREELNSILAASREERGERPPKWRERRKEGGGTGWVTERWKGGGWLPPDGEWEFSRREEIKF